MSMMKHLRALLSWSPFATGLAALLLLFLFDRWLFARFFHVPYWQWYLKNGSLIGLLSAIMLRIWGTAADKHPALISAHPLVYLSAWLQFIGLPVYALGTQIKSNRDKSLTRSVVDGILSRILIVALLVPAILVWFIVIVPAQFMIYFVCGAPVRFALMSDRIPVARLKRGGNLDVDEAARYRDSIFTVADLKNAASLIRKLAEPRDYLSEYLHRQLSSDLRQELAANKDSDDPPHQLKQSLVSELNRLLKGKSLYTKDRFFGVTLSTRTLMEAEQPEGEEERRAAEERLAAEKRLALNRTLLEEAYPNEIAPSLVEETSDGWWNAGFGNNPVSMTNALATLLLWVLQRVLF